MSVLKDRLEDPLLLQSKCYVDGKWVEAASGKLFSVDSMMTLLRAIANQTSTLLTVLSQQIHPLQPLSDNAPSLRKPTPTPPSSPHSAPCPPSAARRRGSAPRSCAAGTT
ncbi:hypothetical protein BBAD15_g4685 [Beauveria bassiana D1-5]|uniref:Uncharacterized protein n=1 Tax=Beauveria bassiana D1-5 TaxID=1245745 RepID=A0A0A2VPZ7_BEABA|nr:hypothetical protein BBAD15_g4685 [Beauveria bassiana D1-5]